MLPLLSARSRFGHLSEVLWDLMKTLLEEMLSAGKGHSVKISEIVIKNVVG